MASIIVSAVRWSVDPGSRMEPLKRGATTYVISCAASGASLHESTMAVRRILCTITLRSLTTAATAVCRESSRTEVLHSVALEVYEVDIGHLGSV